MAKRYRKKGLDATARRMVEFLELRGIKDATVLEIGGGGGEIQIGVLKARATRSASPRVQLSAAERAVAALRHRREPRLQTASEGVSELHASAVRDARRPGGARTSPHFRASHARLAGRRARALGRGLGKRC